MLREFTTPLPLKHAGPHGALTASQNLNVGDITTVEVEVPAPDVLEGVTYHVGTVQAAALIEFGVYDSNGNIVTRTGAQEPPATTGVHFAPFERVRLAPGTYRVALTLQAAATTLAVGVNQYATTSVYSGLGWPLPASLSGTPTAGTTAPWFRLEWQRSLSTQGLFTEEDMDTIALCLDGSTVYGYNASTFKIQKSTDDGATWTEVAFKPSNHTPAHMLVNGGKFYTLGDNGTVFVSSDLTSSLTWTDITPPNLSTNATGRPYCLIVWNGYLWMGEYNQAPNEIAGGPKIHRYDLTGESWVVSKQFANARHIHAFATYQGDAALMVSIGDQNYGDQVGLHRMTSGNINAGGPDSWLQWTAYGGNRTTNYPVDFVMLNTATWCPQGAYGASDTQGGHVEFVKTSGNAGFFNNNMRQYADLNHGATETARSIIVESGTKNLYWWTDETSVEGMWMSPPPYERSVLLATYPTHISKYQSLQSGDYLLMGSKRYHIERLVGQ